MPFKALLKELVTNVGGAQGAIFLDVDGEAVEWYSQSDGERLRLRAAYVAVVLQAARTLATRMDLGATNYVVLSYEGAKFLIEELESGYFLVLELSSSANVGEALYHMKPTVVSLRREIAQ